MIKEAPKKIISIGFYRQANGQEPVREWLKSLKKAERKTIGEDIKMVQEGWPLWACPWLVTWGRDYGKCEAYCQIQSPERFLLCIKDKWYSCMDLLKRLKKLLCKI